MSAAHLSGIARQLRIWLCSMVLLPWLATCAIADGPKKVPLEVTFTLDKGGEVVELEVLIPERQTYTFGIGFMVNRKIPGDSQRVLALVGTAARNVTGKYVELGVPLRLRLEIESMKTEGAPYHFDQEISEIPKYATSYEAFEKRIANVKLEAGTYHVKVTNLLAAFPVQGTPINFHIRRAYFGK